MLLRDVLLFFVASFLFGHSFGGLCGSKPSKIERSKSVPHRRASAPPPAQMRRANSTPKKRRNPSKNRVNSAEHPPALSRHPSGRQQCFDDTIDFLNNRSSSSLGRQRSFKGRKSDAKGNLWEEYDAGRVTQFPLEEYHTPITEYIDRTRAHAARKKSAEKGFTDSALKKNRSQKRKSLKKYSEQERTNDYREMAPNWQSAGYRDSYGSDSSYRTSYGFDGTPTSSNTFGNGTPSSLGAYERKAQKEMLNNQRQREKEHRMDQLWQFYD